MSNKQVMIILTTVAILSLSLIPVQQQSVIAFSGNQLSQEDISPQPQQPQQLTGDDFRALGWNVTDFNSDLKTTFSINLSILFLSCLITSYI